MLRVLAGMACASFLPIYFLKVFPGYKEEYAVANAAALAICGLVSSMAGGIISDKFESKNLMAKSYVCIVSSLMTFPLTALCCLNQHSFWFSMGMITLKTLMSAAFSSPAITMIQNTTSKKNQGRLISAYMFFTTISSTIAPILFSAFSKNLGAAANPSIYGYIITVFALIGYWGSLPFWYMAGKSYKKFMEAQRLQQAQQLADARA